MKTLHWLLVGIVVAAAGSVLTRELSADSYFSREVTRRVDAQIRDAEGFGVEVSDALLRQFRSKAEADPASREAARKSATVTSVVVGLALFAVCATTPLIIRRKRARAVRADHP
jgi:hypothetical protein